MKPSTTEPITAHLEAGARAMVSVVFAVALIIYTIHAVTALLYPYPLDYGEAPLVDQAMRLAQGQTIYQPNLDTPPYTITNYPPFYVLAMMPFVALFGPNFWAGRLISALCALATACFVGGTVRVHAHDRFAGRLSGLLFLALPYVAGWSKLARIDLLALAFSTAALYVISRWPRDDRALVGTAALLLAAIYTRQSYGLAAPLAAFVWTWAQRGWRPAFKLAGMVGGGGLALFVILNLVTGGGFFFNVVTANVNPFNVETVARYAREVLHLAPILLIFGVVCILVIPPRGRGKLAGATGWFLVVPYLAGATLSALTIGKIGSNVNYLLEFCAVLALVGGTVVAWSGTLWRADAEGAPAWLPPLARGVALLLLAVQAGMLMGFTLLHPVQDFKYRSSDLHSLRDLHQTLGDSPGPVLADELMGMLTLNGEPLYIQPFEVTQLANAGLWDQAPFLEALRAEQFPMILIHHYQGWPVYQERWTPEMLDAITEHYVASNFAVDTIIFRPRSEVGAVASVERACAGAVWALPSAGELGMWWYNQTLSLMGAGYDNTVPVYAVADGVLMRRADWPDAVAILHADPLAPDAQVWTFYGGMASADGGESYISAAYPPDSAGVRVRQGDLLGYQGSYPYFWVHLHFAVLPVLPDGGFPAALVWRDTGDDPPLAQVLSVAERRDPSDYLNTLRSPVAGTENWLSLRCQSPAGIRRSAVLLRRSR